MIKSVIKTAGVINLGCSRNLVDSQVILGQLKRQGYRLIDAAQSDTVVVNTCGFIDEAKKESIDTILKLIELKKKGKLSRIVVAGCLAQRYGKQLANEFKEVDEFTGVQKLDRQKIPEQVSLTPRHFAYVKICESCYNRCSFCVIPIIKGKFVSRTIESVVREVQLLDKGGGREINIIGQDITAYGMDIYRQKKLSTLLKKITAVTKNIQWIRLLYAFPAHVTDELIDTIAQEEKICKYIDIPFQHISNNLLKEMNRGITTQQTFDLIHKIRSRIPQAHLRTTFIVGLPGETDKNFKELIRFVQDMRFDKVGAFVYSREEGSAAYSMPGQVPASVKKNRLDTLMRVQQKISLELQKEKVGHEFKVLIDEVVAQKTSRRRREKRDAYIGRTQYDAPEVDGNVYVYTTKKLNPGDIVSVRVTNCSEYDLEAEPI